MFETQCEEVTEDYIAEGELESHEIEVKRAKDNILFRLGSTDESRPKLYGSGCNVAVPRLFEKKEVKHSLNFHKLKSSDKDKWFNHVLETLANYEVGKAHKEKEKEEAEKEAKFKKKLKAAELRALLEAAEREEQEEENAKVISGKNTTGVEEKGVFKRLAGAVADTTNKFAEANKAPKLGN
ncbi:hypothetical protein CYMTET_38236 [Cymbomonas tetramitiformis]|uniref:Uncharacterized protein n=1 Tax=Cymbomonas tetramitiformis TaxID=36881 RepID=A0AAE0CCC2_9CHLO|nr:hypothetical protein CYMTET_38236 [Cymbomonas tetramitiformis]